MLWKTSIPTVLCCIHNVGKIEKMSCSNSCSLIYYSSMVTSTTVALISAVFVVVLVLIPSFHHGSAAVLTLTCLHFWSSFCQVWDITQTAHISCSSLQWEAEWTAFPSSAELVSPSVQYGMNAALLCHFTSPSSTRAGRYKLHIYSYKQKQIKWRWETLIYGRWRTLQRLRPITQHKGCYFWPNLYGSPLRTESPLPEK